MGLKCVVSIKSLIYSTKSFFLFPKKKNEYLNLDSEKLLPYCFRKEKATFSNFRIPSLSFVY